MNTVHMNTLNNARRLRQIIGSSCCLQEICGTFETIDKWNQVINRICYTNGFVGSTKPDSQ